MQHDLDRKEPEIQSEVHGYDVIDDTGFQTFSNVQPGRVLTVKGQTQDGIGIRVLEHLQQIGIRGAKGFINQDQRRQNPFLFGLFNQHIPVS